MSDWTTLGELKPGTLFETRNGDRGVRMAGQAGPIGSDIDRRECFRSADATVCWLFASLSVRPLPAPDEPPSPLAEEDREAAKEELARLFAIIAAPGVGVIRCPDGLVEAEPGRLIHTREYARELLSKMAPGASLILPSDKTEGAEYDWTYEPPALAEPLRRLCWLLGLSAMERAFVQALADAPSDAATLNAFRDWLTEQGRDRDAAAMGPRQGLYLVERTDVPTWDDFFACVVAAGDEATARKIHPHHQPWGVPNGVQDGDWWPNLRVTRVGDAGPGVTPDAVVCASNVGS